MDEQIQDSAKGVSEKDRIKQILSDPNTTAEEREDIMCHLTGILLAQELSENDTGEPLP